MTRMLPLKTRESSISSTMHADVLHKIKQNNNHLSQSFPELPELPNIEGKNLSNALNAMQSVSVDNAEVFPASLSHSFVHGHKQNEKSHEEPKKKYSKGSKHEDIHSESYLEQSEKEIERRLQNLMMRIKPDISNSTTKLKHSYRSKSKW